MEDKTKRITNFTLTESQAYELVHAAYGAVKAKDEGSVVRHYVDRKKVMKAIEKVCKSFGWNPIEEWTDEMEESVILMETMEDCPICGGKGYVINPFGEDDIEKEGCPICLYKKEQEQKNKQTKTGTKS